MKDNGISIHIDDGAVTAGSGISALPISVDKLKAIGTDEKFERVVSAFDISADNYDGSILDGVELTIPMPKLTSESDWNVERARCRFRTLRTTLSRRSAFPSSPEDGIRAPGARS